MMTDLHNRLTTAECETSTVPSDTLRSN